MSARANTSVSFSQRVFFSRVTRWWRTHRRDLPWRRTIDPYRILISEVMLQQTQVARVLPAYRAFLKRYPSVQKLASANQADVVRLWLGLGYNRRARALHQAARRIVTVHTARIPLSPEGLKRLPGIGVYSAHAILAFAEDVPVLPIDTNIRRVLIRHFGERKPAELQVFGDTIARRRGGRNTAQMLMDYGALVCTGRNAQCDTLGLFHIAESPTIRPQPEFRNSDRFFRGKVLTAMSNASHALSLREVRKRVVGEGEDTIAIPRLRRILKALAKDAMVEFDNQLRVRLVS